MKSGAVIVKKRRNTRKRTNLIIPFLLFLIIAVFFIYADFCLRPTVVTMAKYKLQGLVEKAVNSAIITVMDQTQYKYDDLVEIRKNSENEIVSVSYNSLHINKLRSELVYAVMDYTQRIPDTYIYIPIGNMAGIDILNNKGPKLKFKIQPSSYTEAEIESVFRHTGINQINHQIFINIKVTANALIPNYSTSIHSENKICVAETVIIGKVPNELGSDLLDYN